MRRCRACPGPHPKPSLRATARREAPWRHRPYFSTVARLPRIDESWPRTTTFTHPGRLQRFGNEATRVGGVDHVIDLKDMSGVERLGVFLRGCGSLAHPFLTLFVIHDGIELFAQAQPNGALQPHWPEVGALARPR